MNIPEDLIQKIEEFKEMRSTIIKSLQTDLGNILVNLFKQLKEENGGKLYQISWHQYTPYFNDGEPCEFGLDEIHMFSSEEYYNECEEESYYEGDIEYNNSIRRSMDSFVSNYLEDFLEEVFGNNKKIIIREDEFILEDEEAPY